MGTNNIPSCIRKSSKYPIKPPGLPLKSTLIGSNYPSLELIFMVPKVFQPLKFDCISFLSPSALILFQRAFKPKMTNQPNPYEPHQLNLCCLKNLTAVCKFKICMCVCVMGGGGGGEGGVVERRLSMLH